ncbi:MAG: hypothetical protein IJS71_09655 [Clostridia bacterium]|nr:hypothetical protein [Clostridia bacterium]
MKKLLVLFLSLIVVLSFAACTTGTNTTDPTQAPADATDAPADKTEAPADATEALDVKSEGVMTYAEYIAAPLDSEVVVETYVQDHQSWWDNKITVYTQDKDGAYFLYELKCSEEDAAKLVPGQKIKVTGTKSEWAGEIEIAGGEFELEEGSYIAPAVDVTELLGKDELKDYMNRKVTFKGLTIAPSLIEDDETEYAFFYRSNNSGEQGDDLYFKVSINDQTYTFTVESYLRGKDTDVYKAVEALKVGDVVDLEGYLYWYEGVNPHITAVTVK